VNITLCSICVNYAPLRFSAHISSLSRRLVVSMMKHVQLI